MILSGEQSAPPPPSLHIDTTESGPCKKDKFSQAMHPF